MIWKVPEMIADLSRLFALAPGDLIYSGTTAGVGAVVRGDRLHGHGDGVGDREVTVVFARVKAYRPDKRAGDADAIDTVRAIHRQRLGLAAIEGG